MRLLDVNVLLYAINEDADDHAFFRRYLEDLLGAGEQFGMSDHVLSAVVRIATHPSALPRPATLDQAFAFCDRIRSAPTCIRIEPGPRHWQLFEDLCHRAAAKGKVIPDAYFAAVAIESGCEWVTTDRDYRRFPGLTWRHPLDAHSRTNPR